MRRVPTVLLLFVLAASCQHHPDEGVALLQYEDVDPVTKSKETYSAYTDANGAKVKHGLSIIYYPSGAKLDEMSFSHGKAHGRYAVFSEEGRLVKVGYYRNDKPWEGVLPLGERDWVFRRGKRIRPWEPTGDELTPAK